MAQIFLLVKKDSFLAAKDFPMVDETIRGVTNETYTNMLTWLVDNEIHFHSDIIKDHAHVILKDEDAMAFKLRWVGK